jgi:hypothetical protein
MSRPHDFRKVDGVWQRRERGVGPWQTMRVVVLDDVVVSDRDRSTGKRIPATRTQRIEWE